MRRIIHEQNDPTYLYIDIGLVKLEMKILFRDYVQTISLNSKYVGTDFIATVSGWGQSNI